MTPMQNSTVAYFVHFMQLYSYLKKSRGSRSMLSCCSVVGSVKSGGGGGSRISRKGFLMYNVWGSLC